MERILFPAVHQLAVARGRQRVGQRDRFFTSLSSFLFFVPPNTHRDTEQRKGERRMSLPTVRAVVHFLFSFYFLQLERESRRGSEEMWEDSDPSFAVLR
jgi:hypothetical protein